METPGFVTSGAVVLARGVLGAATDAVRPGTAGANVTLAQPPRRASLCRTVRMSATADGDNSDSNPAGGGGSGDESSSGTPGNNNPDANPPPGKVITTALEMSFRAVWIQLLTAGVGEAYELAIANFCVACVAARKAGYTLTTLKLELAANELEGESPDIQKAQLNDREKETRLIWIVLVFLTLQRYKFDAGEAAVNDDVLSHLRGTQMEELSRGLNSLVESICDAADRGYNLSTYKMEQQLSRSEGDEQPSAATLSIQSQWSRIVFATYSLLPDALTGPRKRKM